MYLLHGYLFFNVLDHFADCILPLNAKTTALGFLWSWMSNRITSELCIQVHSDLLSALLSLYTLITNQRNHYDFD